MAARKSSHVTADPSCRLKYRSIPFRNPCHPSTTSPGSETLASVSASAAVLPELLAICSIDTRPRLDNPPHPPPPSLAAHFPPLHASSPPSLPHPSSWDDTAQSLDATSSAESSQDGAWKRKRETRREASAE
eukprot:2305411-Rhodomonas_salina.1